MSVGRVRTKSVVVLFIAASLVAGSLAVALPLNSTENNNNSVRDSNGTDPQLRMYEDPFGITELPTNSGAYVVVPGEIVYLQIMDVSDNKVMRSGTIQSGEMDVLVAYTRSGTSYYIQFKEVMMLNGDSEIFPWTVGDFDADLVYNPADPDDAEIACGTTGVIIYGRVSTTSILSILQASGSTPDFTGSCGFETSGDTGSSGTSSSSSGSSSSSSSGSTSSTTSSSGDSSTGSSANEFCVVRTITQGLAIWDEENVSFITCTVGGNITVDNSLVTFQNSNLGGDLDAEGSTIILRGTTVQGDVIVDGGTLRIEHTTILGDLTCLGGTDHMIVGTTIKGIIAGCTISSGTASQAELAAANYPPALVGQIGNKVVDELATLTFTAVASDTSNPSDTLTFSLTGAPLGASINATSGVFTWTPNQSQGPGNYTFSVVVTDNGSGLLTDSEVITVTVNAPPDITPIGAQTVNELATLSFTATATDPYIPGGSITFSLSGAVPSGASINATSGVFTWTPTEAQGPGSYTFSVLAYDGSMTGSEIITVTVNEVNVAPVLDPIGNKSADEEGLLTFTATASDADVPANTLTFSLSGSVPTGASINATSGVFTWTPTAAQGPANYTFDVVVTDNGTPALSDSETITVTVAEIITLQVKEGYDQKTAQTLTQQGKLSFIQADDTNRIETEPSWWHSFEFDSFSFPGGATIQSVEIYIVHHEEIGFGTGELTWHAGQGTLTSPTSLTTMTPAILSGESNEGTHVFDVSSVIDTTSEVNNLKLKVENNNVTAKKTKSDYIYVKVKYTV